ncbi:Resolvase-domain containing protein [Phytophthora palmivora]|uniref:Resolvase-domain containing protein n=1 Tax=Phytophthora palmivora TaxID=4796 RepID=A0A2P4XK53_9STRA|nr:Resolvase-domain containing protein [Phytophthora palmivora]
MAGSWKLSTKNGDKLKALDRVDKGASVGVVAHSYGVTRVTLFVVEEATGSFTGTPGAVRHYTVQAKAYCD